MTVKVLTSEGLKLIPAEELTFQEHLEVIDHWRGVFAVIHARGLEDEDWLAERLAVMQRAEDQLLLGEVPHKGPRPKLEGPS